MKENRLEIRRGNRLPGTKWAPWVLVLVPAESANRVGVVYEWRVGGRTGRYIGDGKKKRALTVTALSVEIDSIGGNDG